MADRSVSGVRHGAESYFKQIEKAWKSVDLKRFWFEVEEGCREVSEQYRIARAKSYAQASSQVFV